MDNISDDNPELDNIEEQGWCWIQGSTISDKWGCPYARNDWAERAVEMHHPEEEMCIEPPKPGSQDLMIVWLDNGSQ